MFVFVVGAFYWFFSRFFSRFSWRNKSPARLKRALKKTEPAQGKVPAAHQREQHGAL